MFELSLLKSLVHGRLNLLSEGRHLVLLLLDELGLSSDNLLVALLHVPLSLLLFHLLSLHLDLMSLSVSK